MYKGLCRKCMVHLLLTCVVSRSLHAAVLAHVCPLNWMTLSDSPTRHLADSLGRAREQGTENGWIVLLAILEKC